MEKKEFQRIVKKEFKILGYQFKGNNGYKIIDNEYLIGICLEHHSYCKGYIIYYGVVYLPDEDKMPFKGWFDWHDEFLFTRSVNDNIVKYDITNLDEYDENKLVDYFEYENREKEELVEQLNNNIKEKLNLLSKKEFVLDYYKKNIDKLIRLPDCTIEKLLKRYDYDRKEINRLRRKWGYDKYDF